MKRFSRYSFGQSSSLALAVALTVPAAFALPAAAQAQEAQQNIDIAAGDLGTALQRYSAATGVQLVYSSDLVAGKRSPGVSGRMSLQQALEQLLAGTGLSARVQGNTATLVQAGTSGDIVAGERERVLGSVRVEGSQGGSYFGGAGQQAGVNGVNGSRDITATEGTGSFTSGALTIGSKAPQAIKDVPQSVSVLTSERLEQQNVTDFTDAMRQLPGVTLVQGGSSLETQFYSRGFLVTSIQVDGGAPLSTFFGDLGNSFVPQIDMSIYDHVELLRGAAGKFGSYGEPGGTVNLVRKKPLHHSQFSIEAQAGSWSNYRVVADASSPLAFDGKLRGRLVMTYQDNHYFYDDAKDNKALIYGITEFDLTPTTLLTAGFSHTRQDSVPWILGLPRYHTGADLRLPRSTSLVFSWNRWDFDTTEIFGGVAQNIGTDWNLKLNITHNRQSSTQKVGYYTSGAISPTTLTGPELTGDFNDLESEQLSAELTLSGAFEVFGQRQEVTIGANRIKSDAGGQILYPGLISYNIVPGYQPYSGGPVFCNASRNCPVGSINSGVPVNVFNFNPSDPLYTEPRNPLPRTRFDADGNEQLGAFIDLRLTAFDRLHLMTGLRWSRFEYNNVNNTLCVRTTGLCAGKQIGDVQSTVSQNYRSDDISWPPPVNLSFDITKSLTAYAGYTDIYVSQANLLGHDRNPLPPVTGSNWEAGLKWAARDGKLNLSLSVYKIQKKGFATIDPPDSSEFEELGNGVTCCYIVDPDALRESKGFDIEVTGEIVTGWQVAASYTNSENRQKGGYFGVNEENREVPFVSIQPKHLYKLWMTYDFKSAGNIGVLSGLSLSGGINGQSSAYNAGSICLGDLVSPFPTTPSIRRCSIPEEPFEFTVPGYAVISARIDYRLSKTWSLAVNLENILDKTYYQTVGSTPEHGNWYGAPRSVTATLRASW